MTGWVDLSWLAFDLETTGVSYDDSLVLSSALVNIRDPNAPNPGAAVSLDYLDHGLEDPIPAGHIHRLSADFLAKNGGDPAETLEAICLVMAAVISPEQPLVGMNVTFDLTMLDRNCRRYGVTPLSDRCEIYAVDCYVLDKLVEPYRKGKRNLERLAALYRVQWDEADAHDAAFDALAAARVAWRIGRLYPRLGALGPVQLHQFQVEWKRDQDASFADYRRKKGEPTAGIDGFWPLVPFTGRADPRTEPASPPAQKELEDAPLW